MSSVHGNSEIADLYAAANSSLVLAFALNSSSSASDSFSCSLIAICAYLRCAAPTPSPRTQRAAASSVLQVLIAFPALLNIAEGREVL